MKAPASLLSLLSAWAAALAVLPAATAPRISQILREPGVVAIIPTILPLDADGDGDLDLVVVPERTLYDTNRAAAHGIFIENLGSRSFAPPRAAYLPSGGKLYAGWAVGDFHSTPGQEIMAPKGLSTGGYVLQCYPLASHELRTGPITVPVYGSLYVPSATDLDGDGIAELLVAENHGAGRALRVADRQADGSYQFGGSVAEWTLSLYDNAIRVLDWDGDGDLDLLMEKYRTTGKATVVVFERTGHRTFAPARDVSTDFDGIPEFADLDGDGSLDCYQILGRTFRWQLRQGAYSLGTTVSRDLVDASFQHCWLAKVTTAAGGALLTVVPNRDRTADAPQPAATECLTVRFGTWETVASKPLALPDNAGTRGFAMADFDNDGIDDIPWLGSCKDMTYPYPQQVLMGWGGQDGYAHPVAITGCPQTLKFALIRDWDRDGDPDVLTGADAGGRCQMLVNDGKGEFSDQMDRPELGPPPGAPAGTYLENALAGDVDGDGRDDLVLSYVFSGESVKKRLTVLAKGNGNGTFQAPALSPGGFDFHLPETEVPSQLIDFDGDGDLDVISQSTWTENKGAYFDPEWHPLFEGAFGGDIFGNPLVLNLPHAGDLDGDGHPEFINTFHYEPPKWTDGGIYYEISPLNSILIAYNDGQGGLESADELRTVYVASDIFGNPVLGKISVADVNADGLTDLCSREFAGFDIFGNPFTRNYWRRNPGGGSRGPHAWLKLSLGDGAFPDSPVPSLDFNGDGIRDWVSPTGYLRPTPSGPVASSGYDFDGETAITEKLTYMGAADFDGDGDSDFLLYNKDQPALFLMRNLTVDERSPIVRSLVTLGVAGGLAGPDNDADGDGRSNFTELLEGTDPLLPDAADSRRFSLTLASGAISFDRRADAEDLGISYRIETSGDLIHWAPLDAVGTAQPLVLQWERVTLPLPSGGPTRRFFRLAATPESE